MRTHTFAMLTPAAIAALALALVAAPGAAHTPPPSAPVAPAPPAAAVASDPTADAVMRAALETARAQCKAPAIAAIVINADGTVLAQGAVGVRRAGEETPVTTDDRWHLGSCTKAMTATLAAILVREGVISWDTTLAQRFPDLAERMPDYVKNATLKSLLSHRAGIVANIPGQALLQRDGADMRALRREYLEQVCRLNAPAAAPGTFLYSNAGYVLAGAMLEEATGRAWEDLMRQRLFEPLGMASAGFGPPGTRGAQPADAPRGHRGGADNPRPVEPGPGADNPQVIGPAGTVHASLEDWGKFIALHLRGPRLNDGDTLLGLTRADFDLLHMPAGEGNDYALGWGTPPRPWAGGTREAPARTLTHSGSNTMWFCTVWAAPAKGRAVLVATNAMGNGVPQAVDGVAGRLIRQLVASAKELAAPAEPATR